MRCRQCGKQCVLQSSQSLLVGENTFQTTRVYKCPNCDSKFKVIDDPIQIEVKQ